MECTPCAPFLLSSLPGIELCTTAVFAFASLPQVSGGVENPRLRGDSVQNLSLLPAPTRAGGTATCDKAVFYFLSM